MDQLICASLSHTHYWYEVGMLKVPSCQTTLENAAHERGRCGDGGFRHSDLKPFRLAQWLSVTHAASRHPRSLATKIPVPQPGHEYIRRYTTWFRMLAHQESGLWRSKGAQPTRKTPLTSPLASNTGSPHSGCRGLKRTLQDAPPEHQASSKRYRKSACV